ncbi:UNVERIFIED_CONTAM: hypothetical protein FKN15_032578 [Acipenser sinensis]
MSFLVGWDFRECCLLLTGLVEICLMHPLDVVKTRSCGDLPDAPPGCGENKVTNISSKTYLLSSAVSFVFNRISLHIHFDNMLTKRNIKCSCSSSLKPFRFCLLAVTL